MVDQAAVKLPVMEQNEAYGGSAAVRIQDKFPYRISEVWRTYLIQQNSLKKKNRFNSSKQNCLPATYSLSFNLLVFSGGKFCVMIHFEISLLCLNENTIHYGIEVAASKRNKFKFTKIDSFLKRIPCCHVYILQWFQ